MEFVAEALEISKRLKRPVKLIYTREDDIRSGYFRPYSITHIKASADKNGNLPPKLLTCSISSPLPS